MPVLNNIPRTEPDAHGRNVHTEGKLFLSSRSQTSASFRFLASVYVVETDLDDIGCVNTTVSKQSSNEFGLEQGDKGNVPEKDERTSAEGMRSLRETSTSSKGTHMLWSPGSTTRYFWRLLSHFTRPRSHMRTAAHPCYPFHFL
jgi:hypothetical protein